MHGTKLDGYDCDIVWCSIINYKQHISVCVCLCKCVSVYVCVHVYVVYEDTHLYNDMGMT